ncbi:MAG TPA: substrate-binding domain-containing protein [Bryobacteraceae bacterium]|nr:substrate-binding domain-containing protein [Bryobacteraceae bacterium]
MEGTDPYRLGTLEKGLVVLELLERAGRALRIPEIVAATGLERGGVFRILHTLESRGYVERLENKSYRASYRRRRTRIGYSAPLAGTPFRRDVTLGIQKAATGSGLELIMLNSSDGNPDDDLANAQVFIEAKVDVVIMFQPIDVVAHVLGDRFIGAGLPVIAVENPIPGAVFFGGNNYRAGLIAGNALGAFAREHWRGSFDRLILVESSLTSPATRARLTGTVEGVRQILPDFPASCVIHLDGLAHREATCAAIGQLLQSLPRDSRLLFSAFNDPSAIGAVEAVLAARRAETAAIVGQNATTESRVEMCRPGTPLIGSVAYFPERYGEKLVRLALAVLNREPTPLAVYTEHVLLDCNNIGRYYPDVLVRAES